MTPEFSRPVEVDTVSEQPRRIAIDADEAERRRLAGRFRLVAIGVLSADVTVQRRAGLIHAEGRVEADVVQGCVVTGDPLPAHIDAPFSVRFAPDAFAQADAEEIELSEADCDTLPLEGGRIDLGELAAETLALALDPYPRTPGAAFDKGALDGDKDVGPFAALKALKDRMEGDESG